MKITVPPELEAHGVTLIHASEAAPGTISGIAGADLASIQGILPYAVVLVNSGPHRLLQVTVGFKWTGLDHLPRTVLFTELSFNEHPADQVKPGGVRLFVPQRGLNLNFAQAPEARPPLSGWSDILAKMETDFSSVSELTAFIDSVTIESVGLVGPDMARNGAAGFDRKTTH